MVTTLAMGICVVMVVGFWALPTAEAVVPSADVGVKENLIDVAPAKPPREARMLPVVIAPVRLPLAPIPPDTGIPVTTDEDVEDPPTPPPAAAAAAMTADKSAVPSGPPPPEVSLGVVTEATISPFSSRLIVIVSFCKAVPKSDIFTICLPDG